MSKAFHAGTLLAAVSITVGIVITVAATLGVVGYIAYDVYMTVSTGKGKR